MNTWKGQDIDMKKWIALLLSILLTVSCLSAYAAEEVYSLESGYVSLHEELGLLMVADYKTDKEYIAYPDGTPLNGETYCRLSEAGKGFEFAVNYDTINCYGLLDSEGNVIVPAQYSEAEYLSDRWQVGAVMVEGTADEYDYAEHDDDNSVYYLTGSYDVYYNGSVVGQFTRDQYDYAFAYGDYLCVYDRSGNYTYYDNTLTVSPYKAEFPYGQEYDEVYGKGYFHMGSGQQAFVSSCTLTAEQVETSFVVVEDRIVDLQGNVLGEIAGEYDYVDTFEGDYALVIMEEKYGLIDKTGREVLPCVYDEIGYGDETFFEGGYQVVVKDGKIGYVDVNGNVTCEFKYSAKAVYSTYSMPFNSLVNLDGSIIVLSGKVGELSQCFTDVTFSYYSGCPLFAGEVEEGKAGVFDLSGNAVIPADGTYESMYDFEISKDGTVVVATDTDYNFHVFTVSQSSGILDAAALAVQNMTGGAAPEAETAPAADGWNCTCGSVNTGNFCPECGSARPAEKLVCQNCGFEPAEGETPKFCSECGTAF